MEDVRKIFAAGAKKIAEIKGLSQEAIAEQIEDGKQGTVSSWLRGRTKFPMERMPEFAKLFDLPIEAILEIGRQELQTHYAVPPEDVPGIVQKEIAKQLNDIQTYKTKKNSRHHDIVDQFQNSELLEELNSNLLELEKYDIDDVEEINEIIKAKLKKHRKKHGRKEDDHEDQKKA